MALWPIQFFSLLAQTPPWGDDGPPPAPAPAPHRLSFSDLQQGLHDYDTGKTNDNAFRNGVLVLLAIIAVITLVIHFRQRHKDAGPPDSLRRLSRELSRLVRFPLGTRMLLFWVARSTHTPLASLLLSGGLFDKCLEEWSHRPTFSVARRWGKSRLDRLRPALFEPS